MKKNILLILSILFIQQLHAADYYWVGGGGNWSDLNHWATTSGGTTKHSIVPGPGDDVYFDANSGLVLNATITFPAAGHAYCRNMSWVGVTANAIFRNSTVFSLYIYGNAELSAGVRYSMHYVVFAGSGNANYKINGASSVNSASNFNRITVDKTGGSLTLLDDIPASFAVGQANLLNGHLDLSGGTHDITTFLSNNSNSRSLDISNATITAGTWDVRGNATVTATGSYIIANLFHSDGNTYPKVDVARAGVGDMQIYNSNFGELTFTSIVSAPGTVSIGANNVVNRLEFKSGGALVSGGNVINQLILAPGRGYWFYGNNTINGLLQLNSPDCNGFGELRGMGTTPTLTFGAGATTDMRNVYIKDLVAASATTINVIGADGGGNTGFTFTPPAGGTTLYWVGGKGNWDDKNHWSATSGGTGGYCVPFQADSVVFDANSGFANGNDTVFLRTTSWCHGMTWTNVQATPVLQGTGYSLEVSGSLSLDPTLTINGLIVPRGTEASTLTANGYNLGILFVRIEKTGTDGGLSLVDNLTNTNLTVNLVRGKFLLPGRTLNIYEFTSSNSNTRTLDISNANITIGYEWNLAATNCSPVNSSAGSLITASSRFLTNGFIYDQIQCPGAGNNFSIFNATINELVYTNTTPALGIIGIRGGNTIGTLEYKGSAEIRGNNTIDNLLLAPSRSYIFRGGMQAINGLFRFISPDCSGLGEMRGVDAIATLDFGASSTKQVNNVLVENINATGTGTPIPVNGADAGGNTGFTITSSASGARHWIGGSGDWNDASHWSTTPGGLADACVPTVANDVYFDASSFTNGSSTVSIQSGNAYCHNMDWTGAVFAPVLDKNSLLNLDIWGDLVMNPAVTMNARVTFTGAGNNTITSNASTQGDFDMIVSKPSGSSIKLLDNYNNPLTRISLSSGSLDLSGRTAAVEAISDNNVAAATSLDIENANITAEWRYSGANKSLQAADSRITANYFVVDGGTYNYVDVTTARSESLTIHSTTLDSLIFSATGSTSNAWIGNNNTINYLEFKDRGQIIGTGNTIGDLVFAPGEQYIFQSGSTNTITGNWYGSGTPCSLTEIYAASTTNATVNKTSGAASFDYIRLRNITATGSTPFIAEEHSVDLGGNVNWNIEPYNGSTPMVGLGPDIALAPSDFPYTLTTNGFFGSPSSQYLWNDNSTLDHLTVTEPGTYSVAVSFTDGCSVSDQLVIIDGTTLPVSLISFNVSTRDCQSLLNWKVTDVSNFSHFAIEQSKDGRPFTELGQVLYEPNIDEYAYTDKAQGNGIILYRLRLVDMDGTYKYSSIASVN